MSAGRLGQFLLYAVFAAGALGELSQVWGEIALAAGAAERIAEMLALEPQIRPPPHPIALPVPTSSWSVDERCSATSPAPSAC